MPVRGDEERPVALLVRGRVESAEGVVNVVAERLEPLILASPVRSRDFR